MLLSRFTPLPTALAATLVLTVLSACSAGVVPTQTQGSVIRPADRPPIAVGTAPEVATGRIQRLEIEPGHPASFLTQAGKQMTVVASSAAYVASAPNFRLVVAPLDPGSPASAYALTSAEGAPAPEMPYSAGYTASTAGLLTTAAPAAERHLLAATPRALGSEDTFWVNTGNSRAGGDVEQTAVLTRITDHAYFYLDKQSRAFTTEQLDQLASEFETKIYPREAAVFGDLPKPGIDGDDRMFIVISPAVDNWGKEKGLMGYFWSRDAIPSNNPATSHSNQKEVLFMTDALFKYPALTSFGTMAHEYQHLLNFTQKAVRTHYTLAEDTWLDEGMAMYAMEVAGYGLTAGDNLIAKDLNEFQQNPVAYSLTDWNNNPHGFAYGQSYLFVRYLVDRYGPETIKAIIDSDHAGEAAVEDVLAPRGDSFAHFFTDWAITNLVSGTPLAAGTPFNYKDIDLAGNFGGFQLKGFKETPVTNPDYRLRLRPWGTAYLSYSSSDPRAWELKLADPGTTRLFGAAIVP